jgi:hypothetical protein
MLKLTVRDDDKPCHVALDKITYVTDYKFFSAVYFVDGTSVVVNESADSIVDAMRHGD